MFSVFPAPWERGCVGMAARDHDLDYHESSLLFVENKFIAVYLINHHLTVDINSIVKSGALAARNLH